MAPPCLIVDEDPMQFVTATAGKGYQGNDYGQKSGKSTICGPFRRMAPIGSRQKLLNPVCMSHGKVLLVTSVIDVRDVIISVEK